MTADMRSVFSSNISEIGYDADTTELVVRWNSGKTSVYGPGVPAEVAERVMNAASVGQAVNQTIKPGYPHRYA